MRDVDWDVVERTLDLRMQHCARQAAAAGDDDDRSIWQDEADAVLAARAALARLRVTLDESKPKLREADRLARGVVDLGPLLAVLGIKPFPAPRRQRR